MKNEFNATSLAGKTVVFTGKLGKASRVTRKQAFAIAAELGAIVKTRVSSDTDYVIAGVDAGQKLQQAVNLNVEVMPQSTFFAIARMNRAAAKKGM